MWDVLRRYFIQHLWLGDEQVSMAFDTLIRNKWKRKDFVLNLLMPKQECKGYISGNGL
jgi:hypothetical protein